MNDAYWTVKNLRGNGLSGRFPVQRASFILKGFYAGLRRILGIRFMSDNPPLVATAPSRQPEIFGFHFVDEF